MDTFCKYRAAQRTKRIKRTEVGRVRLPLLPCPHLRAAAQLCVRLVGGRKIVDEIELRASFRAMGIPFAFLHRLPLLRNDTQRLIAIPCHATLNQPTPNYHTRAADPATAMNRADPSSSLIVFKRIENAVHVIDRLRQGAVTNGEAVVFDGRRVNPQQSSAFAENVRVRQELTALCQIDERSDTRADERVQFRSVGVFRRPGVFTGKKKGSGPIGVGYWTRTYGSEWAGTGQGR